MRHYGFRCRSTIVDHDRKSTDVIRMLSDGGENTSFMKKAVVTILGETFFRDPNGNASIWSNMKSRDAQEQEEYF